MKLTTKKLEYCNFIEVKADETEITIYENGNECSDFIQNLLETIDELCRLRNESAYEYFEKHYNIKIQENGKI